MTGPGATPLFVDTGAFYARADSDDRHHGTASRLFEGIRSGGLPFRPLYTSQAVLSELATLLLYKVGHDVASRTLTGIREAESFTVLPVDRDVFGATTRQFVAYDDQSISFVDHSTSVLAENRDVDHVFAFDDDFGALGLTLVPGDVPGMDG